MKKIKIHDPYFGKEEKKAIEKVLDSRMWASSKGNNKASEFEEKFKNFVNADECVAIDSSSSALLLSMNIMDIKNKEVIIPSLCHVSVAHAVVLNGGKPVFIDVDPKTLCINANLIKKAITKKTKVVVAVHFGGFPCNMDEISDICKKYKIKLIEDAALAAGSSYKNKKIGSHSDIVCFSFHPVKIMASPKGGAITLNGKNSNKLRKILLSLRNSGISHDDHNSVTRVGWNCYMNEFSAAICLEQLKKINKMISLRFQIAKKYHSKLNIENKMPLDKNCSYNFYWIFVKNPKAFIKKMNENNVEIGTYHPPIHTLNYYKTRKNLLNTEYMAKHHVLLPTHPNLLTKDIEKIVRLTNKLS